MKRKLTKAITLGGIYSAVYATLTILSVYVIPFLSVVSLIVMPIFAAYYASVFKTKETLVFNLCTLVVCLLVGLGDPMYTLMYVLPTLIVGDLFGLFNRLNIKYYTTIFLQTITFSITNFLSIWFSEKYLEVDIIKYIISDPWLYENLSLVILFTLSGAEAVLACMFVFEKLAALQIIKEREKEIPTYLYISEIGLFALAILMYFINNNFYFLFVYMTMIVSVPVLKEILDKIKRKELFSVIFLVVLISICYVLCMYEYYYLVALAIIVPITLACLVKLGVRIYNLINGSKAV